MSLVTFIKDYFEIAINYFFSVDTEKIIPVQDILSHVGQYLWQNSRQFLYYIISFEWFRDNVFLPVHIPSSSEMTSYFYVKDSFTRSFPLTFLETGSEKNKIFFMFFIGFLNSFFLSLPFSCSYFISIRRMMIQGIRAGICAGLGTAVGQFLFVLSFVFGFRFLVTSWLTFEPYNYFLGICFILFIIHDMVKQRILVVDIEESDNKTLKKIFFINFVLAWVEQSYFNQFLSNVTFLKEPSIFEGVSGQTIFPASLVQWSYGLGILVGSIVFTCFFIWGFYFLFHYSLRFLQTPFKYVKKKLNTWLLVLIFGITLHSFFDYGADYLLTAPVGFISEDKALKKTVFYPFDYNLTDPILVDYVDNVKQQTKTAPLEFDVATFDKGLYLRPATKWKISFESLTFNGETSWRNKRDYEADTWMERFKDRRSQKAIKRAVEYFLDKAKGKSTQKVNTEEKVKIQKTELQFIPTDSPESSVLNTMFFKKKFEDKFLRKTKKLHTSNFEDFLQTFLLKSDEKNVKQEKKNSLIELSKKEQDTILQLLNFENQELNFNTLESTEKKELTFLENLWNGKYKGKLKKKEFSYKDHRPFLEKRKDKEKEKDQEKELRLIVGALKSYSLRLKDMFQFSTKSFREHFFENSATEPQEELYKNLYYSNPIYKLFLMFDVDTFLNRQPKKYQLTPSQENLIFQKRQVLHNYYESLYQYTTLLKNPHNVENLFQFNDISSLLQKHLNLYSVASKSYSNRVYNQQFKGTLNVVRKLFSITPDSHYRFLKYDQPLFSDQNKNETFHFLHEDLLDEKFQNNTQNFTPHPLKQMNPYLEKIESYPLYSGWDSKIRKFVITTRFKSRLSTGSSMTLPSKREMKKYSTLRQLIPHQLTRLLSFTRWPLTKTFLETPKSKVDIKYETLFESKFDPLYDTPSRSTAFGFFEEPDEKEDRDPWEYTRVPTNVAEGARNLYSESFFDLVPPPRGGGFVWPGYHFLPTSVKETLHTLNFEKLKQKLNFEKLKQKLNFKQIFAKKTIE